MEYTELGSTGLEVSVIGLGAGGSSKLGLDAGRTKREARRVVETALDLGITFVDTAEAYGTEEVVGAAIGGVDREEVVLSTKVSPYDDGELRSPDELEASLEASLDRLDTGYVDVYHLHAIRSGDYDDAVETLLPRLEALVEQGVVRFTGITESTSTDPGHDMLSRAVADDAWDVVMVGFNLLNHSARQRVLEPAARSGVGTIGMVPVRRTFSDQDVLDGIIAELLEAGDLDPASIDRADPFGFLIDDGGTADLVDAAYRFARYEPTIDTVLTGTSSTSHLRANVESALSGPLPAADLERLSDRFGHVDSVLGI